MLGFRFEAGEKMQTGKSGSGFIDCRARAEGQPRASSRPLRRTHHRERVAAVCTQQTRGRPFPHEFVIFKLERPAPSEVGHVLEFCGGIRRDKGDQPQLGSEYGEGGVEGVICPRICRKRLVSSCRAAERARCTHPAALFCRRPRYVRGARSSRVSGGVAMRIGGTSSP